MKELSETKRKMVLELLHLGTWLCLPGRSVPANFLVILTGSLCSNWGNMGLDAYSRFSSANNLLS